MKAHIDDDGLIVLTAEDAEEGFALGRLYSARNTEMSIAGSCSVAIEGDPKDEEEEQDE